MDINLTAVIWEVKKFDELSAAELYAILELRNKVFVVEQNCVYNDTDRKDLSCLHLMGWLSESLVAYTRIVPPGISYLEPSIGRVVNDPEFRKKGLGFELLKRSIELTINAFNEKNIRISAQLYLLDFYASQGFKAIGEPYLEDNIPHIEMLLQK